MAFPQLFTLRKPKGLRNLSSGQRQQVVSDSKTWGFLRELRADERFDGTSLTRATVEIRIARLAAPAIDGEWKLVDDAEVVYHIETATPSPNRQHWLLQCYYTSTREALSVVAVQEFFILREDGSRLLREDGSGLLREESDDPQEQMQEMQEA